MNTDPATEIKLNRLFYAYHNARSALDERLNRLHRHALVTVSRFLGYDVEFLCQRPVSRHQVPF